MKLIGMNVERDTKTNLFVVTITTKEGGTIKADFNEYEFLAMVEQKLQIGLLKYTMLVEMPVEEQANLEKIYDAEEKKKRGEPLTKEEADLLKAQGK